MVLLANEFLKQEKSYIEEGVHPCFIIKAIRKARETIIQRINELATKVRLNDYEVICFIKINEIEVRVFSGFLGF